MSESFDKTVGRERSGSFGAYKNYKDMLDNFNPEDYETSFELKRS